MRIRYVIAILFLAAIAGCAAPATQTGPGQAMLAAPELGLIVNEKMEVVDMMPLGAAAKAGVQIGDILVSIEPAPPLPPGQEPTPEPVPQDVITIIADEHGRILEPTPVPGEAVYIPGSPVEPPTPIISLTGAPESPAVATTPEGQVPSPVSTPDLIDPEATATAAAMQATAIAASATAVAEEEQKAYVACLEDAANDPVLSEEWCIPPGGTVLTDTVYFTETARIKWKFVRSDGPNRMLLTVIRNGEEIKIEVTPARPNRDRPDQPDRGQATKTPIPPSYHYF